MKSRLPLIALFVFAFVWPIAYNGLWGLQPESPKATTAELQNLLNVRRYTLFIPREHDGKFLTLVPYVDGQPVETGGASVRGGSSVVLLVRRDQQTEKIEYCWTDDAGRLSRGTVEDPIELNVVSTIRGEGQIAVGDWIYRGGRESVDGADDATADFELRLELR